MTHFTDACMHHQTSVGYVIGHWEVYYKTFIDMVTYVWLFSY